MIDVIAFPRAERRYSVGLDSPPPTQRAVQLEDSLLSFVSKKLGCEVSQITRGENSADASEFYYSQVKRIENLFREVEELGGGRHL